MYTYPLYSVGDRVRHTLYGYTWYRHNQFFRTVILKTLGTLFVLKVKLIHFLDSGLTNVPFLFSVRKLIITGREFRH